MKSSERELKIEFEFSSTRDLSRSFPNFLNVSKAVNCYLKNLPGQLYLKPTCFSLARVRRRLFGANPLKLAFSGEADSTVNVLPLRLTLRSYYAAHTYELHACETHRMNFMPVTDMIQIWNSKFEFQKFENYSFSHTSPTEIHITQKNEAKNSVKLFSGRFLVKSF